MEDLEYNTKNPFLKVLSIDFDYIMAPCIKLYNDLCEGKENSNVVWKHIEAERNIEPFLNYDAVSLIKIARIIKSNAINGAKIVPIKEHQEIVELLCHTNKGVNLVNIDFHHDIMYHTDMIAELTDMHNYNCENWVYYLHNIGKLKSYTWIKAPQSDLLSPSIKFDFNMLGKQGLDTVDNDFDMVVFCLSPQWVPYKFHHLYDLILELCKETAIK